MRGRSRLMTGRGAPPLLLLLAMLLLPASEAQAKVTRYLTGNAADVSPALAGPAHDFGGGGTDVDAALQWIIDQVRGCTSCATKLDVVILRSSGSNGYNDYIYAMNGVDSVRHSSSRARRTRTLRRSRPPCATPRSSSSRAATSATT